MKASARPDRTRSAVAQTLTLLVTIGLFAWGQDAQNPLLVWAALAWALPIIFTIELGHSRGRTGWMWGLFLGWLGVLILACMSKTKGADEIAEPQRRDPRAHDLQMRELEVRELEAKVRLAELGQSGEE